MSLKLVLTTTIGIAILGSAPSFLLAQAQSVSSPTPLRPATVAAGSVKSETNLEAMNQVSKVALKPTATYLTEVRFVSFPVESTNSLPQELKQVLQLLKPEQVSVLGGSNTIGKSLTEEIPMSSPTSLSLKLNSEQKQALFKTVAGSAHANMMTAPNLLTYAGQYGQVNDGVTRTFVTALETVETEENGKRHGFQPQVKNFFEGIRMSICVEPQDNNKVQLSSRVTLSKIDNVIEVPIGPAVETSHVRIQFPEVTTTTREFEERIDEGQSIAFTLGVRSRDVRSEVGLPIPGASKLFKKTVIESKPEFLAVVLTVKEVDSK